MKFPNKEILKTVAITVLLTANVAFILGIKYNQAQTKNIQAEVNSQIERLKVSLPETTK